MTAPAFTDRTAPAPWASCDGCHAAAGALETVTGQYYCPECTLERVLYDAAEAHLRHVLAPVLGAWVSFWAAAGVGGGELQDIARAVSGSDLNDEARDEYQRAALQRLGQLHPVPQITPAQPDRVTLDPAALPRLTGTLADLEGGRPGAVYFQTAQPDGTPGPYPVTLPRGCDAVLILPAGPAADGVLYFTGLGGQLDPRPTLQGREAYRVPAALLPAVREALGYFPEGARPEGAQGVPHV